MTCSKGRTWPLHIGQVLDEVSYWGDENQVVLTQNDDVCLFSINLKYPTILRKEKGNKMTLPTLKRSVVHVLALERRHDHTLFFAY